jgi:hypothetical protein
LRALGLQVFAQQIPLAAHINSFIEHTKAVKTLPVPRNPAPVLQTFLADAGLLQRVELESAAHTSSSAPARAACVLPAGHGAGSKHLPGSRAS